MMKKLELAGLVGSRLNLLLKQWPLEEKGRDRARETEGDALVGLSGVGRLKLLDFDIKDQKEALDFTNIITAFFGFRSCTHFEYTDRNTRKKNLDVKI